MILLGIETSCDETAAALVRDGREILSSLVSSQVALHAPFGGVVPEIASRSHLDVIHGLIEEALAKAGIRPEALDAIAVTNRPGLIGSLLVGLATAKTLAFFHRKPLVGVHHVEAHIYSTVMENPRLGHPFVSLVVSGGHTNLYLAASPTERLLLGQTVDDAAGEAFDKVAAILGLPYPGGPSIEKTAEGGDPRQVRFPLPRTKGNPLDFSFSGLKTAVLYEVRGQDAKGGPPRNLPDLPHLAASFQETAVEHLVRNTLEAARREGVSQIGVGGGVACNQGLRDRLKARAAEEGMEAFFPSKALCLDNAAMIAGLGYHLLRAGRSDPLDLDASAR